MFRKNKENESLVKASRKALLKAEERIQKQSSIISEMREENIKLYEEKKQLNNENEELKDIFIRVESLISSNKYNNEKSVLNKVKELISDYHSQN